MVIHSFQGYTVRLRVLSLFCYLGSELHLQNWCGHGMEWEGRGPEVVWSWVIICLPLLLREAGTPHPCLAGCEISSLISAVLTDGWICARASGLVSVCSPSSSRFPWLHPTSVFLVVYPSSSSFHAALGLRDIFRCSLGSIHIRHEPETLTGPHTSAHLPSISTWLIPYFLIRKDLRPFSQIKA